MGWDTVAWCEWNEFGQKVLSHHFPNANGHGDINKTDFTIYRGQCDILTGGFPCQPYSNAGKRLGKEDDRHLWPEMLRAIREIQPRWVVGENVRGLVNWNGGLVFDEVQADLEAEGYEVLPFLLPACAVNAPHRRDRIWFVAYSKHNRYRRKERGELEKKNGIQEKHRQEWSRPGMPKRTSSTDERLQQSSRLHNEHNATDTTSKSGRRELQQQQRQRKPRGQNSRNNAPNTDNQRLQGGEVKGGSRQSGAERNKLTTGRFLTNWQEFPTQPPVCGGDDGLPTELDSITFPKWRNESIKAYGNAIVPQVAYQISKAIKQYNDGTTQPA